MSDFAVETREKYHAQHVRVANDEDAKEPRRLTRYVKRKNIRKFTAQLHTVRDNPLVDMIYGTGNLEFIAEKA